MHSKNLHTFEMNICRHIVYCIIVYASLFKFPILKDNLVLQYWNDTSKTNMAA